MIVTHAYKPKPGHVSDVQEIPTSKRLKHEETSAKAFEACWIDIQRFQSQKKIPIPEMCSKYTVITLSTGHLPSSRQVSINRISTEDIAFLKEVTVENVLPDYGVYNTRRFRESSQQAGLNTDMVCTPFLGHEPSETWYQENGNGRGPAFDRVDWSENDNISNICQDKQKEDMVCDSDIGN